MATFENTLYSLPSSPFGDTLWPGWNSDASPASSDDGSFNLDSSLQPPLYYVPDYYCFFDKWSGQPTTALTSILPAETPVSLEQISDHHIDMPNCASSLENFAAPIFPAAPIAPTATHDLTTQSTPFQDYSNTPSGARTPSDRSSPSESNDPSPLPGSSTQSSIKPNRNAKGPIRCWEHSCGGRAFSSLGNYERHLREKSGRAKSFSCEQCGQRFTRSTAKNKHIRYGRCRARRPR
ncbi:zinc ribbon domain-containing protein [Aspergillus undulatus]|uniref:zinc ribbon domain-containing protein n=1 Tax=Aspergillus undulatus TaxID=1810928 RepID=UPI003CCE1579